MSLSAPPCQSSCPSRPAKPWLAVALLLLLTLPVGAQVTSPTPTALMRSAEAGDAAAMQRLGEAYRDGSGGHPRDLAQALRWLVRAAEAGNVAAMTEAAYGHLQAWGGARNEVEALRWYRRAAEMRDPVGAYWLGEFHRLGLGGLPKSLEESIRWLRVAAEAGNAGAMRDLGAAYEKGQGVAADRVQALGWYRQAAAAGLDVAADVVRLGGRPVTTASSAGAAPAPPPAPKPDSLAGVYTCRVSGDAQDTNGFGERKSDFVDATLTVTVAEDLSAKFEFTRPPYDGTFRGSSGSYRWSEDMTTDSGNERRRTNINFSAEGLRAFGSRNVRTFWRPFGGRQMSGQWAYQWNWEGRCRRSRG